MCAQSLSCVWLFATLWTVARQAPLTMGFPRQECWSGLPFPFPKDTEETNKRNEEKTGSMSCILNIWSKESKNTDLFDSFSKYWVHLPNTYQVQTPLSPRECPWHQKLARLGYYRSALCFSPFSNHFIHFFGNPPSRVLLHNYIALPILVSPVGSPHSSLLKSGDSPAWPS